MLKTLRCGFGLRAIRVEGDSMSPALVDGQYVLLMPPFLHGNRLRQGDVVVIVRPERPYDILIKRVIAMPDESIVLDDGRFYVDDLPLFPDPVPAGPDGRINGHWWNGPDDYFVLGDNPSHSTDSRSFGYVPSDRIIGLAWLRIWPPKEWGRVR